MRDRTDHAQGLYDRSFEHDSCGFGLIAQMDGRASHWLVETAISSTARLTHRGAVAADGKSGDGCGLLLDKPDEFLRRVARERGLRLQPLYAVGAVFLSPDPSKARAAVRRLDTELARVGLEVAGWRPVPHRPEACGAEALRSLPEVRHIFVNPPRAMQCEELERRLFLARRRAEQALEGGDPSFYVSSLSSRVLSYKGMVMPARLPEFYPDLEDDRLVASLCVFHQRFSTNTWPQWRLAQPFRYLAHNGEINTIQGNRNWAEARGHKLAASSRVPELAELMPIVSPSGSDSCSLDNMVEVLIAGGMDLFRAMRLVIPPAWQNLEHMDPDLRAFYEYSSMHMEPWDGPAGIVLTDGRYAACLMDRNGLRPARYVVTRDRHITLASEVGVYDYDASSVVETGRLMPGEMIAADTRSGQILYPQDIDRYLSTRHPYREWLDGHAHELHSPVEGGELSSAPMDAQTLAIYQKMFLVSLEEREQVLRVLAECGQEAVGSMGDDTPLPVLSRRVRSLFDSFRQQFAQVTNPPIDPLREQLVMSLETCFGREQALFEESAEQARRLITDSPVLSEGKYRQLLALEDPAYAHAWIDLNYPEAMGLREAVIDLCDRAERAVREGKVVLVLSDRRIAPGRTPVHALLAVGAVHHRLLRAGLRCDANLVVETATARDPHHVAVLLGCGATAVYPYLAYECLCDMARAGALGQADLEEVGQSYRKGINKGLYKIISKMGISTISSYRGAQLFEAVGLHREVVDLCFTHTPSRIQGARFSDLAENQRQLARRAWDPRQEVEPGGSLKYVHGGEYHAFNPLVVRTLHRAVRSGQYADYLEYAAAVQGRPVTVLRDLWRLREAVQPLPIEEVEPAEAILRRFDSAAMSLGALSPEAHETLAEAMNRLGGRSNSGEGGEDPARYGTLRVSKIKQVASGRFGVTATYLSSAEVIQIKIAQGAKPGEGGQLPADKVNELIARLRHASPGMALISPPPHHDIYSIEDLAQLIFDLKQVNPAALVSVKLVSEAGVGTIAAGVAKAYADLITIAGYDGGTGASPLTSVKYAGTPWELGLAETQQTLCANGLRGRVRLQVDGGLKTGLDVVKAAILGAESFGFGTAPMIAMGCKYLRTCHLNNCATGVATQESVLRLSHFVGKVEMVMNFFGFVAQETREWMARLGVCRLTDLIGRTDLLEVLPGESGQQRALDFSAILAAAGAASEGAPRYCVSERNPPFDQGELAERMVAECLPAIETKTGGELRYRLRNFHRSIGARLSGEIARRHGDRGMEDTPIVLRLQGTAGQSFGAWNAGGLHLYLEGDCNDYVGKGMAGGKIVVHPPRRTRFRGGPSAIIGNTCLYGATGGLLYASGLAGERFAVRNSGACAVIEGAGEHCCEYMTGGVVVVLGETGVNFGAGMTGGFAFVLDRDRSFVDRYNHELVDLHRLQPEFMEPYRSHLRGMIADFVAETGSRRGREVLQDFDEAIEDFWLVKPKAADLATLLEALKAAA